MDAAAMQADGVLALLDTMWFGQGA